MWTRIIITYCFLANLIGFGQFEIETVVSKSTVAAYEVFRFEVVMNNFDCKAMQPDFGGLEVVNGPNPYQSSYSTNVNGKYSRVEEFKWVYTLRAKKEGQYTISGVSMNCGQETYTSEPITIQVTKGQAPSNNSDHFLRLTSNKKEVYPGEPFIVTLKYYSKLRPETLEGIDLGDGVGITRHNLDPNKTRFQTDIERINGVRYFTIKLYEELCFAQRTGTVRLEPYRASFIFQRNFFDNFRKESLSNAVEIDVKSFPTAASRKKFNGLVGQYSVNSEINRSEIKIGEAVDLKITLEGTGNIDQSLVKINPKFPVSFNVYEPQITESIKPSWQGMKGKIEYAFTVVPTGVGTFEIPADTIYYFNLDKRKLQYAIVPAYQLTVKRGDGTIDPVVPTITENVTAEELKYIDESNDGYFTSSDFVFGSWTYYSTLFAPFGCVFILLFIRRKKSNLSEEERIRLQQKNALKQAMLALKPLQANPNNDKATLKSLQSIYIQYFKTKFNVSLSELSKREIDERLASNNVEQALCNEFTRIWNAIEFGQFAPIAQENVENLISETDQLLHKLDNLI